MPPFVRLVGRSRGGCILRRRGWGLKVLGGWLEGRWGGDEGEGEGEMMLRGIGGDA